MKRDSAIKRCTDK